MKKKKDGIAWLANHVTSPESIRRSQKQIIRRLAAAWAKWPGVSLGELITAVLNKPYKGRTYPYEQLTPIIIDGLWVSEIERYVGKKPRGKGSKR